MNKTTAITDKTKCLLLRGGYKTYLSQRDYDELKAKLKAGADMVFIAEGTPDEKMFSKYALLATMEAGEVEKEDRIKRGEWLCDYGHWHKKNEQCGHMLQK
jgi:hypothetical protein